ncbi:retrovirus-related pol polyprotein from transposon TNT 1-94 [Tanacetum coccineum]
MTGDRSRLRNFVKKFIETVRFRNDHFGAIMGYEDYMIGDSMISKVYYVEGLGHNLFSIGQFCNSDLEVAYSCYVCDTDSVELIKGSCGSNLYTILVEDMMKPSPICLLSKASKNKSCLWHHRLSHLNFDFINDLARKDLVIGLPRLKFEKDHLCSACQLGKSKSIPTYPKLKTPTWKFTWVKFLRSKDESLEFVIKFLKQIQVDLNKTIKYIRTDNGTEFVNQVLTEYYESVSIFHQKSVPRTPRQNDVKLLLLLVTPKIDPSFTLVITKPPYELVHNKKPNLTFLRVFGALCYLTNDSEGLGKLQPTADIRIFVGYAPSRRGYRIYNKRIRRIMETIHIQFDELSEPMALVQLSTGPAPTFLTPGQIKHPRVVRPVSPAAVVQVPAISAGTPSSTTNDQDAPSPSHSPSSSELQPFVLHQGVAAGSTLIKDNPFAHADNVPFVNVFSPEPSSKASSSEDVSSSESTYVTQPHHHLRK